MARIKFSGLVSEIRGKMGSSIIQGWKTGVFVIKGMMQSVRNPNSSGQDARRSTLSKASKDWQDVLTPEQRAEWETYALQKPGAYPAVPGVRQLIPSNGGIMSGFNAFVLTQGWLVSGGLAPVEDAPLAATPPSKPIGLAVVWNAGVATITWTEPDEVEANAMCRVWIASASGKFHKQLAATAESSAETCGITYARGAMGKNLELANLVGEVLYVQADIVNPTGGKSAGSNTVETVVA